MLPVDSDSDYFSTKPKLQIEKQLSNTMKSTKRPTEEALDAKDDLHYKII